MSSTAVHPRPAPAGFHLMAKPIGALCNLDCQYCFYLEKEKLYPRNENFRMTDSVLENYVQQYIAAQDSPEITFAWQGGEPTLMGVDFFRRAISFQKKFAGAKPVSNTLQTNGTLLDDDWCAFLAENKFLVGVSIDGPRELHDAYRVDKRQQPTFDSVMRGIELLKKHGVEFNTLTVVNRKNSRHPLEVYRFLKQIDSRYLQFIPLIEREPDAAARALTLDFAMPPSPDETGSDLETVVTEASVEADQYGEFLVTIFEEWVLRDVGAVYVHLFDVALSNWMGLCSSMCVFAERCGAAMALEHNGDVFSCDHYVYPKLKLGNLLGQSLGDMARSPVQKKFGADKFDSLPNYCRECEVRFACNGECPKHRFIQTPDGEPGLNYLCAGYKKFFNHIEPYMVAMGQLLQGGKPATMIMDLIAQHERSEVWKNVGRNDACPCGSGKKYKHCCLERRKSHSAAASSL